ncbi:MAG: hypothetical protein N3A68_06050 [Bacteroidia bacterium]|nr:hypothetical protein [Bacteroidia bacterium]
MKLRAYLWLASIGALWAQNVGIGTATPQARLHVFDPMNGEIRLEGTNKARFLAYSGGQLWIQSGAAWTAGSTADILFSGMMGTPVHMAIQGGTGNVGIGTTTPAQRLHVNGGTIRVSALSHTDPFNRMVVANSNGDLALGDAPYGYNVQSATLTTTQTKTTTGWANLLSVTFTPRHNRVFVFASFTARLTNNAGNAQFGQALVLGRIVAGGTPMAQAAQVITDYDYDGWGDYIVTSGGVAFSGIPVNVTPGTPVTVTLQWDIVVNWADTPWQVRIAPGTGGDHAVLTILD